MSDHQTNDHITLAENAMPNKRSIWRSRAKVILSPILPFLRAFRGFLNAPVNNRLGEIEARQANVIELLNAVRLTAARAHSDAQALQSQIQVMHEHHERQSSQLENLMGQHLSSVGDRFNEIEVKIRPLVEFETAYAIRLGDGYVLAPKDEPIFALMLMDATTGGLEPGTRKCIQRLLLPGMRAIDVGANIGLHTLACARSVGASGKVYAFEPEERIADLLVQTLRLNGLVWVDMHREAAGAKTGSEKFHISQIPGHSSLYELPTEEEGGSRIVNVVRLDDVIPDNEQIDFIKIDVEGAELDVLKGASRIIDANPNIVLIAEYGPSHLARTDMAPNDWFAAFYKHGFRPYAIVEPSGICELTSIGALADVVSINVAFVRAGSASEERLLSRTFAN